MEWILDLFGVKFLIIFVFFLTVYYYGKSTYNYWKKMGVIYMEPKYPFLGNSFETAFSIKTVIENQRKKYYYFKGYRYGGIFSFRKPVLFLTDPELIESVLIKDFQHFYNRGTKVDIKLDPLSNHLVHLENEQWKTLRTKLTPIFSSHKLKGMHEQLMDCTDELVSYLDQFTNSSPFEAREMMGKFTTDVIASCAFGLNVNSIRDPNSEFRKIGRKVFKSSFLSKLRLHLRSYLPWLLRLFNWKAVSNEIQQFFTNTIVETLEYREKHNIKRDDFLYLLNELRKKDLPLQNGHVQNHDNKFIFDMNLLVANTFVFFLAGFETTASTLSYALYELAMNEDIQDKAYSHVMEKIKKYGGVPSYEAIKEMDYLDQIASETLRKYPPVAEVSRKVTRPYRIPDSSIVLDKNSLVAVPIYALQHDSKYFPDPERFMPERFSEENKDMIKKGTFLPFGDGPRICIGMRFARMEIKAALAKILMKYKVSLNKKTISPLQYDTRTIFLVPIGGIWLDLRRRNS